MGAKNVLKPRGYALWYSTPHVREVWLTEITCKLLAGFVHTLASGWKTDSCLLSRMLPVPCPEVLAVFCIARFKLGLKWGHIAGFMGLKSQLHCTACKQLLLLHCVCLMSWCHPDFLLQAVLVQCNHQLLHAIAFSWAPRVATQYLRRIAACKVLAPALSHHVTYIIVIKS